MTTKLTTPEFSRRHAVTDLAAGETTVDLAADATEREALARRFGLLRIEALTASLTIVPEGGGQLVRVRGTLGATVVQACVVTLEPVVSRLSATFERAYGGEGTDDVGDLRLTLADDTDEPREAVVDGIIDLGEAVAEQLAIEIDPFPRAPGARFSGFVTGSDGEDAKADGPFAALAGWRRKGGG